MLLSNTDSNKDLDMNKLTARTKTLKATADALIASMEERAQALADQAKQLQTMLRKVRGTRDVTIKISKEAVAVEHKDPNRPFFVGADATHDELYDAVERCITGPDPRTCAHTLREIVELTGEPNRNRISGILVKLQVHGRPVKNLGDKRRAIWWIAPRKRPYSSKTER